MSKFNYKYDFFISSSSKDLKLVERMFESLKGYRVFHADTNLKHKAGEAYFEVISRAILQSENFILVVSPDSMKSKWVHIEYQTFFNKCYTKDGRRRIILLKGDGFRLKDVPVFFSNFQIADSVEQILSSVTESEIQTDKTINSNYTNPESHANKKWVIKPSRLILPVTGALIISLLAIYFIGLGPKNQLDQSKLIIKEVKADPSIIVSPCNPADLLIFISSKIDDLSFESNILPNDSIKVIHSPERNEYVICHPKERFILIITGPGYEPNAQYINGLKWRLKYKVTGKK